MEYCYLSLLCHISYFLVSEISLFFYMNLEKEYVQRYVIFKKKNIY